MLQTLAIFLTILFVGLKLCHQIDWSWWACFSPVIVCFIITLIIFLTAFWVNWRVR